MRAFQEGAVSVGAGPRPRERSSPAKALRVNWGAKDSRRLGLASGALRCHQRLCTRVTSWRLADTFKGINPEYSPGIAILS